MNYIEDKLNELREIKTHSENKYTVKEAEQSNEIYFSDGKNAEIDIYEFSNREKLVRVLTHELGHALELEHVEDEEAIMYKFNHDNNQTLTEADLAELRVKCEVE